MREPASGDRTPVVHAVHRWGLASETFIRDAITEVSALGWPAWVVTEDVAGEFRTVAPERIVVSHRVNALVDRVGYRLAIARGLDPGREYSARKYLAALSRVPPGIVHAHFGWTAADCVLAARKLGMPLLVSFHGTDLTVTSREPAWAPYYAKLFGYAHGITVVSRFLETTLRKLGYEGPIDLVPSGVRLDEFPFSGGPRPGSEPRLLFVGRLIACKGLDVLLAAMAAMRTAGIETLLRVVGDGPLRAELEASGRAQGLASRVQFRGALSRAEVRQELEASDIVVVPSRIMPNGQAEGSSVVSKEAQAVGVPIVATAVGGIPETISPELRHELVRPDEPEALASTIAHTWNQRDQWPMRVRRQREWIAAEFAWEKGARRLSELYDRLLADQPPASAPVVRALRRPRMSRDA